MAYLRYQRHFMALLLGLWLPMAASANDADLIPDHWQAEHCPKHVPEGKNPYMEMNGAHIDSVLAGDGGLLEQEELDANVAFMNRYQTCLSVVSLVAMSAYRSRDALLETHGVTQAQLEYYSLPALIERYKEIFGGSEPVFELLTELFTESYTEKMAYMDSEKSSHILYDKYFCECMKIPISEFKKL
ncbi:hypothetical protein ACU6TU_13585 [Halomonas sp. LS-001]